MPLAPFAHILPQPPPLRLASLVADSPGAKQRRRNIRSVSSLRSSRLKRRCHLLPSPLLTLQERGCDYFRARPWDSARPEFVREGMGAYCLWENGHYYSGEVGKNPEDGSSFVFDFDDGEQAEGKTHADLLTLEEGEELEVEESKEAPQDIKVAAEKLKQGQKKTQKKKKKEPQKKKKEKEETRKGTCSKCNHLFAFNLDGTLRQHRCAPTSYPHGKRLGLVVRHAATSSKSSGEFLIRAEIMGGWVEIVALNGHGIQVRSEAISLKGNRRLIPEL